LRLRNRAMIGVGTIASIAIIAAGVMNFRYDTISPVVSPASNTVTLDVFVLDDISSEERREILTVARGLEGVLEVRYVSKAAAYHEFKDHYADEPEFWENLSPDALPARFSVVLRNDSYVAAARQRLMSLSGVDDIRTFDADDQEREGPQRAPKTADMYPLIDRDNDTTVYGPVDQPWGWCPTAAEPLTSDDVPAAEGAIVLAAEPLSAGLDTRDATADGALALGFEGPPDFARMIEKDCGLYMVDRTAMVTLSLPRIDSASMGTTTYFVSREDRGWVVWGAW